MASLYISVSSVVKRSKLQRVQVCEEIINLFVGEHIAEALHLVPPHANDVPGAVIIGR
ncbi:MAG: hypothetical protein JWN74_967 [Acidobacteriaceae bacterium]|nr:hypothetical protein [Acidobacteriaceae bacterium]